MRLLSEIGAEATRERAARRLEAFVAAEANRRLGALKRLGDAMADGRLRGLARGLAYQLVERFGILDRGQADEHIRALSRQERRSLKSLGVRFGAFSLYLPALLAPEARAIGAIFAGLAAPRWRPAAEGLTILPHPAPPPEALSLRGLRAVAGMALPVLALERLDALSRVEPERAGAIELTAEFAAGLGWTLAQAEQILRGLGFQRVRGRDSSEPGLWRRRSMAMRTPPRGAAGPPVAAWSRAPRLRPFPPGARVVGGRAAARGGGRDFRLSEALHASDACRVDVWLWRARFFKTRSLAARIVGEGGVRLTRGGARTPLDKPSRGVRPGDVLSFAQGPRWLAVRVEALGVRRGPASEARALYSPLLLSPVAGEGLAP